MIRLDLIFVAFAMTLFFVGCSEETYRIEDSVCGKFLATHLDLEKKYQYISCFDSTHLIYQLKREEYEAYLADVQDGEFKTSQFVVYDLSQKIFFTNLDSLKSITFKEDSSSSIRLDSSYFFSEKKRIVRELVGVDSSEFERMLKSDDTLYAIVSREKFDHFFKGRFSIARKNDSSFYVANGPFGGRNKVMLFSRNGQKIRDLFSYGPFTSCYEYPPIFHMKPKGTDSTFFMEFSYVREEENDKVYKGFVSYNLKNDSLSYGSDDSLTLIHAECYKTNGDTLQMLPKVPEDFYKKNRKDCVGHVIY